jgi:hypothetical protein
LDHGARETDRALRPGWDRLALFAHIWALATLCDGARWIVQGSAWGWPLTLTALAAVLDPRRLAPLGLALGLGTAFTFVAEKPQWTPNHTLFIALGNLVIGAALLRERRGLRGAPSERAAARERALEQLAPSLVWMLLAFYAFVVLHKLNLDFLDPEVSCAAQMYGRLQDRYGFLPERTPGLGRAAIWGTLAAETLIPLLLALRPTRSFGVLLGFGFHFVLAQHPHGQLCSFGSLLYAVYFLCLPRALADGTRSAQGSRRAPAHASGGSASPRWACCCWLAAAPPTAGAATAASTTSATGSGTFGRWRCWAWAFRRRGGWASRRRVHCCTRRRAARSAAPWWRW